ncbi:hypothetical protein T03_5054 [Trichinella britovi]|uniref:Uncharacterized protein n=1 Tax=Trichinella britovi TaxID=45882 RepID=A0A0V0YYA7_TRIBR|nr:hypothetical protein T03_5054 [Trichinella britovi]
MVNGSKTYGNDNVSEKLKAGKTYGSDRERNIDFEKD